MKRYPVLFPIVCLIGSVGLTGCAGMGTMSIPDTTVEVSPGAIQGSVFGGHAPIVGARVYVLETAAAYGAASISKLTSGSGTDSHGTYVTTNNNGEFNITGAYGCDVGRPVYLAAAGGAPDSYPPFAVTSVSVATTSVVNTYNFTFTGSNLLYVGQGVLFSGLTRDTFLNTVTTPPVVTAATTSSFTISVTTAQPVTSGSTTGTVTPQGSQNPAIVNLAVLGLCPGTSGEFASTLKYVYMNEVSTAAAAYGLAGFGNGPYSIGAPGSNLLGIQRAATNAGQLFDIQGSSTSTTYAGEGHIARALTPQGNGVVPQKTLDALGNILASCVDSNNTTTTASTPCVILLGNATDSAGTAAPDTATAAFNIAHNPAGPPGVTSSAWVNILYSLPTGVVPFSPTLTSQPNDFMVGIAYTQASQGVNAAFVTGPQSIASDSLGNVWYTTQSGSTPNGGYLVSASPVGLPLFSNHNTTFTYGNVTVDTGNNAWTGNLAGYFSPTEVVKSTYTLYTVGGSSQFTNGQAAVADFTGGSYFVHGPTAGYPVAPTCCALELSFINSARTVSGTSPSLQSSFGINYVSHGAIDSAQYLWLTSEGANAISRIPSTTATGLPSLGFPINSATVGPACNGAPILSPEQPAIDAAGTAWVPLYNGGAGSTIVQVTPSAAGLTGCSYFSTGQGPYGAAVDGANNVWITNRGGNSLSELAASSGASVPPGVNFTVGGLLSDPMNVAIDISGNLIVTNFTGNTIVEVVGAAAPTASSLAAAAAAGKLGAKP